MDMDDLLYDLDEANIPESALVKKKIFANTSLTVREDKTIHFLVTPKKGQNYTAFCGNRVVLPKDPVETLKRYTEHTSDLYTQVNLSLAADSTTLAEHSYFINELRASVINTPLLDTGTFFRGVDLSDMEIEHMERLGRFFIPSFTSTSIDSQKAYSKKAMLHVKTSYLTKYACSVTSEHSNYHSTEQEVLLACYCAFQLEKIESVNGKKIVTLFLDDFASSCDVI